jgi:hypothetical protein
MLGTLEILGIVGRHRILGNLVIIEILDRYRRLGIVGIH